MILVVREVAVASNEEFYKLVLLRLIKQAEKGNAGQIFYRQKLITLEEAKKICGV